jgi:hypothetical protein
MIELITTLLYPILATVLTGVVTWAVKKYLGIELDKNQQAQAKQIIRGVEEKAVALCLKGTGKVPGNLKHDEAVDQLQKLNPGLTTEKAISQIDRAVGSDPVIGAFKPGCNIPG